LLIEREEPAYHYLLRVARIGRGEEVALFRGDGVDYVYRLERADPGRLELSLAERVQVSTDPALPLTLLVALLKGNRMADVIRSVVPLGVVRLVPFAGARGVGRPKGSNLPRWTAVADEAVRQCGRTRRTAVLPVSASLSGALQTVRGSASGTVNGLVFWEEAERSLDEAFRELAGILERDQGAEVAGAVGPEGGFVAEEVRMAAEAGLIPCRMGPRILRSELAAVVAAGLIQHRLGDLR